MAPISAFCAVLEAVGRPWEAQKSSQASLQRQDRESEATVALRQLPDGTSDDLKLCTTRHRPLRMEFCFHVNAIKCIVFFFFFF